MMIDYRPPGHYPENGAAYHTLLSDGALDHHQWRLLALPQ
jgi:hypothetical protein